MSENDLNKDPGSALSKRVLVQNGLVDIVNKLVRSIDDLDQGSKSRLRRINYDTPEASEFWSLFKGIVLEPDEPFTRDQKHRWAWIMSTMSTTTIHHNPKVSLGEALARHVSEARVVQLLNAEIPTAFEDNLRVVIKILDQKAQDFNWCEVVDLLLSGHLRRRSVSHRIAKDFYRTIRTL